MNALEYIQERGLEYRLQSGQIVLDVCPFCGDEKDHFYLDPTSGVFFCHKCQEKGNLVTLQRHLGDAEAAKSTSGERRLLPSGSAAEHRNRQGVLPQTENPRDGICQAFPDGAKKNTVDPRLVFAAHERLLQDKEALVYVTQARVISLEAIRHFRLGLSVDTEGKRWLAIPHFHKSLPVNIKYRSLPPAEKAFRRVAGCPSVLFNGDAIGEAKELFLTEGEIDAVTLWDQGTQNVAAVTTGAGSFDPAWIDQLKPLKRIYLLYDPDEPGQKGAREAARRLGYERCFNVLLPAGQDVNEFFRTGHDIFEFQALVKASRPFDVAGIIPFSEGLKQLSEEKRLPEAATGLTTGLTPVDRIIKQGLQGGELIVLSAPPKTGKTSFALQIVCGNALQDLPALFFCLEMKPLRVVRKIIQAHTRSEEIGPAELEMTRIAYKGKPLYLGYAAQKPTLETVIGTLRAAIQRYGLKLVAFDHLHFLVRTTINQVQEIGLAVQAFKFLAEEMEIPIILIAQPRKLQPDTVMTAMDLKDSASIFSDCDHLIILHRNRLASQGRDVQEAMETQDQALDPVTLCRIEGSRYSAGGEALLFFHGEYPRFDPLKE
ncbi:MAG: DnaB-like helicase C-terminal domain-containing protein [Smithellaceae bacterium]|nr:DnaB-like helicase C-terminal domain-containing protein [Smithellaceae bacterium]